MDSLIKTKSRVSDSLRAGARKRQLASSSAHQSHLRESFCVIGNEVSYHTKEALKGVSL